MPMQLLDARVYTDEGQFYWIGDFTIAFPSDAAQLNVDDEIEFNLNGVLYSLLVESKTTTRSSPEEKVIKINAVSPSVRLGAPRARPITKVWGTTTARDVAIEVANGYPMEWQIMNWPLSTNLFSVTDRTPIEIISQLAAVVGGVVESALDGTLVVRYAYPVSVPHYGPGTITHMLNDMDDILSSTEGIKVFQLYNKFRITSSDAAEGVDRLEFKDLGGGHGEIRAYLSPWRTNVRLTATRSTVIIAPGVYEEREEEETVEIVSNVGSTQYPVLSIVSATWMDMGAGGVTFETNSTEVRSADSTPYGLLKLKYKVRSIVYAVIGRLGEETQFLLEEI